MATRCALVSLMAGVVVMLAVELALRAPGEPELVAAIAGFAVGLLMMLGLFYGLARPAAEREAALRRRLEEAEAVLGRMEAASSSLRHDLRGILSPALLMADRLLGSEDKVARRAAEIMVQTVERAEQRLKQARETPPA